MDDTLVTELSWPFSAALTMALACIILGGSSSRGNLAKQVS